MSREAHVRICGGRLVRSPPATRQKPMAIDTPQAAIRINSDTAVLLV